MLTDELILLLDLNLTAARGKLFTTINKWNERTLVPA